MAVMRKSSGKPIMLQYESMKLRTPKIFGLLELPNSDLDRDVLRNIAQCLALGGISQRSVESNHLRFARGCGAARTSCV